MAEESHAQGVQDPLADEGHRPELDVLAAVLEQRQPDEDRDNDVQAGDVAGAHVIVDYQGHHPRDRDDGTRVDHDRSKGEQQLAPVGQEVLEEPLDHGVVV